MVQDKSLGSRLFDWFNYSILTIFALITVLPFIYIIAGSFSTAEELLQRGFILFPTKLSLAAYEYIFTTDTMTRSLSVTVFITVTGTLINLIFTVLFAYPLAHSDLPGRKYVMMGIVFTMLFSPGMIAHFLIIKAYGMYNSLLALLIPGAISSFNLIILKNFFQQIPTGLEESAKIDGCNDMRILLGIVLPLSAPALATFSLFYAVGHWNTFTAAILYINDAKKWPIQVLLRQIVIMSQGGIGDSSSLEQEIVIPPQTVKMAAITVSTVPILVVYPFLQKHFTKGVMLGSVKG